jgi:hypothetical protein
MTQVNAARLLSIVVAAAFSTAAAQAADAPATAAPAAAPAPAAPPMNSFETALTGGKVHLDFRYRFEDVDQQGLEDDAYASTLRTRLSYTTAEWNGLAAMLEAANVLVVGQYDLYNSTTNGVTDRPTVADPKYTEINQAWLQWKYGSFTGIGGRQVINLDNQRFVGNVGWRQNDQTFDAVTLKLGAIPRTQLFYSWVGNVNRITGPDNGEFPGNLDGNTSLLNARVDLGPAGQVALFDYWEDFDPRQCCVAARSNNLSNNSYGFHYTGAWKFSDTVKANWIGSWAHQTDYGQSTLNYDADYYLIEGGVNLRNFGLRIGYEVLGGNDVGTVAKGTPGFQTPLATLHIFQGWADMFLTTPTAGVQDFYVGGSASFGSLAMQLVYHDFGTDAKALDTTGHAFSSYGNEWDASLGYKFGTRYEALLKYANYSADRDVPGTQGLDTTKTWLQFTASF